MLSPFLNTVILSRGMHTFSIHNTNQHNRVRFYASLGQPLSKQLYIETPQNSPQLTFKSLLKLWYC